MCVKDSWRLLGIWKEKSDWQKSVVSGVGNYWQLARQVSVVSGDGAFVFYRSTWNFLNFLFINYNCRCDTKEYYWKSCYSCIVILVYFSYNV